MSGWVSVFVSVCSEGKNPTRTRESIHEPTNNTGYAADAVLCVNIVVGKARNINGSLSFLHRMRCARRRTHARAHMRRMRVHSDACNISLNLSQHRTCSGPAYHSFSCNVRTTNTPSLRPQLSALQLQHNCTHTHTQPQKKKLYTEPIIMKEHKHYRLMATDLFRTMFR